MQETAPSCSLHAGFVLGLHFIPEDGGDMLLDDFQRTIQQYFSEDRTVLSLIWLCSYSGEIRSNKVLK
jgi:hypothetical protein